MDVHFLWGVHRTLLHISSHGGRMHGSDDPEALSMLSEAPTAALEPLPAQEDWPTVCNRCIRQPDPQACCAANLDSGRDNPDWFDTVTFVGGFAIIFTIMFVCCVHQFRKQTAESRRRRRLRNQASIPPVPPPEPMIVCVDLNKKMAFPLPAPPSATPEATPPTDPQQSASDAASDADIGETRFDRILMRAHAIGSSVAEHANRIFVQPPVSAAQAAGRRMHGWVTSASQSLQRTQTFGAQNDQNEAESGDDVAVPHASLQRLQGDSDSPSASQSSSLSQEEEPADLEGSEQWFKSLPPRHLPFLAVMPNAEVCLCRPLIPKSTGNVPETPVRKPSWCYHPHSPKNYSSGVRVNHQSMDAAGSSSQSSSRPGKEGHRAPLDRGLTLSRGSSGVEAAASRAAHDMHAENSGQVPPPAHEHKEPIRMHGRSAIETITSMPESAKEDIHAVHAKEDGCVVEMAEIMLPEPVLLPCSSSNVHVHELHSCGNIAMTPSGARTESSWFTADSTLDQTAETVAQDKALVESIEPKVHDAGAVVASQQGQLELPVQMQMVSVPVEFQQKTNRFKEKMNGHYSSKSLQSDVDLPLQTQGSSSGSETGASEGGSEGGQAARPNSLGMRSSYYFSSLSGCGDPNASTPASLKGVRTPGSVAGASPACIVNAGQCTPDRASGGASPVHYGAAGVAEGTSVSSGAPCANSTPKGSVHCVRNAPISSFRTPEMVSRASSSNVVRENDMHESHASCSRTQSGEHSACMPVSQAAYEGPTTSVAVKAEARVHATHACGAGPIRMHDMRSMSQRARDWANESDTESESDSDYDEEELREGAPLFAYFYKVNLENTDFVHVLPGSKCMGLQVDEYR